MQNATTILPLKTYKKKEYGKPQPQHMITILIDEEYKLEQILLGN
jgi:hypothetical protein